MATDDVSGKQQAENSVDNEKRALASAYTGTRHQSVSGGAKVEENRQFENPVGLTA